MKKLVCFAIVFFLGMSALYAHPPSDIKISFDPSVKLLEADIVHNTSNPTKHYINKIDVALNGKEIIEHSISRQDNNQSQTVRYYIPDAKDGDKLSVEGYCSVSGKLEKKISVKFK